jgi:hypothetical protein
MLRWSFLLVLVVSRMHAQELPKEIEYATPLIAVVFLAPDCPISQKYMKKLNDLKLQYEDKVTFLAAIPAPASKNEIKDFWSEYGSTLKYDHDKDLKLVKALTAKVTPEIFLFDSTRSLVYRGAIDNWFYELGKNRREITGHYFKDAVTASFNGAKPTLPSTEAVGCMIQSSNESEHHHH